MSRQIIGRKILSQFYNGLTFGVNPSSDFTINLVGSVMQKVKVVHTFEMYNFTQSSDSNTITFDNLGTTHCLTRSTGSWIDEGYGIGDVLSGFADDGGAGVTSNPMTIISVTDKKIIYSGAPLVTLPVVNDTFATLDTANGVNNLVIQNKTAFYSLIARFGLIENNENTNFLSKIDGNNQGYYLSPIGVGSAGSRATGVDVLGVSLGNFKGWQSGNMTANLVSEAGAFNNLQTFEISHEFIILPYYVSGELVNLSTLLPPPLFLGANSLKYVSEYKFQRTLNNPNSPVTYIDDTILGSVAWFNESYNGFNNEFSILSVNYFDANTGNASTGLIVGTKTKVSIVVQRTQPLWSGSQTVGVYVSHLPEQAEYENQFDLFQDNWFYDNHVANCGTSSGLSNTYLKSYTFTSQGASQMLIEFEVLYNDASQTDTDYFIIGVEVASDGLDNSTSDKVMLLADVKQYVFSADISGLLSLGKMNFYPHPMDLGVGGFTDYKGVIEDGILCDYELVLRRQNGAIMNSFDVKIVAYNTITGGFFELENIPMSLASQTNVTQNGFVVQWVFLRGDRPFQLEGADQFRLQTMLTQGADVFGNVKYYGQIAFKMDWQEWLSLPFADGVFLDINEPNNGLNQKASRYSLQNNYAIRLLMQFSMGNGSVDTIYNIVSPNFNILDYDLDGQTPPLWTCQIETFDSGQINNLNGVIIFGQPTEIKATFTNTTSPPSSTNGYYVVIRIEETGNSSKNKIYELSSKRNDFVGNLLEPLSGEVRTKITNVGNTIVGECQTDFNLLDSNKCYDLSARLFCDVGIIEFGELLTSTNGHTAVLINIIKMTDQNGLPLTGSPLSIVVLKDDGSIVETLTGVVGGSFGSFTSDLSGTTVSINGFITGVVNAGNTLDLDKKAWALSQTWYNHLDPQKMTLRLVHLLATADQELIILDELVGRSIRMSRDLTTTNGVEFAEDSINTGSFSAGSVAVVQAGSTFEDYDFTSVTSSVDPTLALTLVDPTTGDRKMRTDLIITWNDGLYSGLTTKSQYWTVVAGGLLKEQYDGYLKINNSLAVDGTNFFLQWFARGRDSTTIPNDPISIDSAKVYLTDNTIDNITIEPILQDINNINVERLNFTQLGIVPLNEAINIIGYNYGDILRFHLVISDSVSGSPDPGNSVFTDHKLIGY